MKFLLKTKVQVIYWWYFITGLDHGLVLNRLPENAEQLIAQLMLSVVNDFHTTDVKIWSVFLQNTTPTPHPIAHLQGEVSFVFSKCNPSSTFVIDVLHGIFSLCYDYQCYNNKTNCTMVCSISNQLAVLNSVFWQSLLSVWPWLPDLHPSCKFGLD